jgi:hypothetical protein
MAAPRTRNDLRAALKQLKQPVHGTVPELVERYNKALAKNDTDDSLQAIVSAAVFDEASDEDDGVGEASAGASEQEAQTVGAAGRVEADELRRLRVRVQQLEQQQQRTPMPLQPQARGQSDGVSCLIC